MDADTKSKIEAYCRAHRASGGRTESPKSGDDDAAKDLKSPPADRTAPNKVASEANAMKAKRGGRMKKEMKAEGKEGHHHAGRRKRASGGGCESRPFTSAH